MWRRVGAAAPSRAPLVDFREFCEAVDDDFMALPLVFLAGGTSAWVASPRCALAPWEPLSILRKLAATETGGSCVLVDGFDEDATRDPGEPVACFLPPPGYDPTAMAAAPQPQKRKYCKYDEIRATLAASRARSKAQGREGCCGKAADHLGNAGPPADSPWAKKR